MVLHLVHLGGYLLVASGGLEVVELVRLNHLLSSVDDGPERQLDLLLQRGIDHLFQVLLSFYLLKQNPKRDVLQEGNCKHLSVDHGLLLDDVDQDVRVLLINLRVGQLVDQFDLRLLSLLRSSIKHLLVRYELTCRVLEHHLVYALGLQRTYRGAQFLRSLSIGATLLLDDGVDELVGGLFQVYFLLLLA